MKKALLVVLVWAVVVNIFALFVLNRINVLPDTAYPWIEPGRTHQEQSWDLLKLHGRWDSNWYWGIADNGYSYKTGEFSNIVFFPLYPLLAKFFSLILFGNFLLAAWLLSLAALAAACVFLYKLVQEFEPGADPIQTIGFLLIFPTAFFFNSIYTESLFLLLSAACFYFLFKGKYLAAGIISALASLTRVTGVLLFFPMLIEYYQQRKGQKLLSKDILPIFLNPLGTLAFMLYHYFAFGDFWLFFKVEQVWGRDLFAFAHPLHFLTQAATANFLLDAFFITTAIVLAILVAKKLRLSYAVYMLLTVAAALSTGTFISIGRYILVLFPMYIFAASIKNYLVQQTWALVSILLLALNIMLFVHFYWAG